MKEERDSLRSRSASSKHETWTSCPRQMSKPEECLPLNTQVLQEKSIDSSTGDEAMIKWNGKRAETYYQAVMGCKHLCGAKCRSFNIKKRDFGLGWTCTFFSAQVDDQNCLGEPGWGEPITTWMKYSYGDCQKGVGVNKNTTATCCDEDLL